MFNIVEAFCVMVVALNLSKRNIVAMTSLSNGMQPQVSNVNDETPIHICFGFLLPIRSKL